LGPGTEVRGAQSSLVTLKNQLTLICADSIYTTISFAGSLQAPMTPLRPTVRTRTQMTVPGVKPLRLALPPLQTHNKQLRVLADTLMLRYYRPPSLPTHMSFLNESQSLLTHMRFAIYVSGRPPNITPLRPISRSPLLGN
jgi:hypothetical protein